MFALKCGKEKIMKKALICLVMLAIFLMAHPAYAEVREENLLRVEYFEHGEGVYLSGILPLTDGKMLLYGYEVEKITEGVYGDVFQRNHAYAACIDQEGNKLWEYTGKSEDRMGIIIDAWIHEDDVILQAQFYNDQIRTTELLAFGQDGVAKGRQSIGSSGRLDNTIRRMQSGFFSGGYSNEHFTAAEMAEGDTLAYLDQTMKELWTLHDDRLLGCLYNNVCETEAGLFLGGWINRASLGVRIPSVMSISAKGEILWQFIGHPYSVVGNDAMCPLPDGGVLFSTGYDPSVATPFAYTPAGTITRLDVTGHILWVRDYLETNGFTNFFDIYPLDGNYVLTGYMKDGKTCGLLFVDENGDVQGTAALPILVVDEFTFLLTEMQEFDGTVYLYGSVGTTKNSARQPDEPVIQSFFTVISPDDFKR